MEREEEFLFSALEGDKVLMVGLRDDHHAAFLVALFAVVVSRGGGECRGRRRGF